MTRRADTITAGKEGERREKEDKGEGKIVSLSPTDGAHLSFRTHRFV